MNETLGGKNSPDYANPTGSSRPRPVLRQAAYRSFIEYLLSGRLKPGHLVSQRELCEATGTTIGSMREALKRLEAERIVTLIPQRGVIVREPSEKEINDIYEFRRLIEPQAARSYAENGELDIVASIKSRTLAVQEVLAQTREEAVKFSRERMMVDDLLHLTLISQLGNSLLDEIFEKIRMQNQVSRVGVQPRFSDTKPAVGEHLVIIEAIEHRDGEAAAQAMTDHLEKSRRRVVGLD
jgi:DNA-binding GntR family transcriptional regulator